jgi:acyl-CoA hydrolase
LIEIKTTGRESGPSSFGRQKRRRMAMRSSPRRIHVIAARPRKRPVVVSAARPADQRSALPGGHRRYTAAMPEFKSNQLSMTVLMSPEMANFSGKVHGGAILRLLDQVAYACASRYAGRYVVTLSVDQVMFRQPIAVGELVTFLASVNYTGTSSMEIGVKVVAEDILKRSVRHANSCFFTMVAVDEDGKPTAVPPLQLETSDERRRHAAALIRRQLREEMEQRHLELLASNPPSPE